MIDNKKLNDSHFNDGKNRKYRQNVDNRERYGKSQEERYRNHNRREIVKIVETKLFISRDELVKYVNEKGQSDALIDIYKIEDELYKLVIKR